MSQTADTDTTATERQRALMMGHAFSVMILGMLCGFMLAFALLEAVAIWPFPAVAAAIPGSSRGWAMAHGGNIMNGLMLLATALALPHLELAARARGWVVYGMIATVWCNACFYVFGNLAPNRGLSMGANRFGGGDAYGALGFFPAFVGMFLVLIALCLAARAAFAQAKRG